ncbi:hypothetical protein NC651_032078 [Populus alba x Populus x berolinensis]|nr:hypothetical protein NC651_032078 [Populus alba x Populus x berolinensis]
MMPGASNTIQLDLSDFEEPENPLTALQILNQALQETDYQDPVRTRILVRRWEAKRGHAFVIFHVEDALEILGKILMKGVKAPKRCRDRLDLSQCNNGEDMKPTKRFD